MLMSGRSSWRRYQRHQAALPFGLLLALLVAAAAVATAEAETAVAPPSALPTTDSTTVVNESFGYTGSTQWHHPPDGVTAMDLVAIGGWGASLSGRAGGRPAKVAARVAVEPLGSLYLMVAGNGRGGVNGEGGFNGGGSGAAAGWAIAAGGGGGGASDARTIPTGWEGTLESRLLVAAGGGGAGSTSNFGDRGGGPGGDAEADGARGDNGTDGNGAGSGGFGGEAATPLAGGAGGIGGFIYGSSGSGGNGEAGEQGTLATGGTGGLGVEGTGTGMGGGGGGGLYGGGGGGGGIHLSFPPDVFVSGGGGGGGGSSLVPPGGSATLAEAGEEPSITVTYSVPGTRILAAPAARVNSGTVHFQLEATEAGSALECGLDREDEVPFEPCGETVEFEDLPIGTHTFEARAINAMGNFDPTPASWVFEVAPEGPPPGDGPGDPMGEPSGPHPPSANGQKRQTAPARVRLGRPKINRRRGIATLPVRVSGAGKLRLLGNKRLRPAAAQTRQAKTVRLKVAPRRKFARRLARAGRLAVRIKVRFDANGGGHATKSRKLVLRRVGRP